MCLDWMTVSKERYRVKMGAQSTCLAIHTAVHMARHVFGIGNTKEG